MRTGLFLSFVVLGAAACGSSEPPTSGIPRNPLPPAPFTLTASLVDSLRVNDTECLFVLAFQANDSTTQMRYNWDIVFSQSNLPGVGVITGGRTGGFSGRFEQRWQWKRPSDGSEFLLNIAWSVTAETKNFNSNGRLIDRC